MGSRCAKLSTGHGTAQNTVHSLGHESSMKKLVACVSQDNFSLSSEGEEEGEDEEEEEEQIPGFPLSLHVHAWRRATKGGAHSSGHWAILLPRPLNAEITGSDTGLTCLLLLPHPSLGS